MKKKKIVLILLIIVTLFMTSCEKKLKDAINSENTSQDNTTDNDNENKNTEDKKIEDEKTDTLSKEMPMIEDTGNGFRILVGNTGDYGLPFHGIQWLDNNNLAFYNNKKLDEDSESQALESSFYTLDISNKILTKKLSVTGEYWWKDIVDNGEGIIYSEDGQNGLYYLNKEENIKIMDKQAWYHISPDRQKIIINGIPAESDETEYKRYLYDIKSKELKYTSLIPKMDYVFSYIAAKWSPDSIHMSSQESGAEDTLRIIDIVKNQIKKEIMQEGAIISEPCWSPDGKNLVFIVQSKDKKDFFIPGEEIGHCMSDVIGLYNTESNAVRYVNLEDDLTVSAITWDIEGKGLFIPTASTESGKKILDKINNGSNEAGYIDEKITMHYLDIATDKVISTLETNAYLAFYNLSVHSFPLSLYQDENLIYLSNEDENVFLRAYNINTKEDSIIWDVTDNEYAFMNKIFMRDNNLVFASGDGVFYIDKDLKLNKVKDFSEYGAKGPVHIYLDTSPDNRKAIIGIEYMQDSKEESFYEIVDLDW